MCLLFLHIFKYDLFLWKTNFQQPLFRFSVSYDSLEIILICWCGLIIISFLNNYFFLVERHSLAIFCNNVKVCTVTFICCILKNNIKCCLLPRIHILCASTTKMLQNKMLKQASTNNYKALWNPFYFFQNSVWFLSKFYFFPFNFSIFYFNG